MEFLEQNLHNGMVLIIGVLLVLAIAYRYYSAFIAAKVLALDANRPTPAHTMRDGQNYDPTNRWVLFGHHFAAISGAGPLIGPVLAAQYGFLPGLLWILIGVCLAGAVQDFIILGLSIRRGGKSLAQIAYMEIGPVAGTAATIGILFVLIIALAGLGKVVVKALGGETVVYPAHTRFIAPHGVSEDGRAWSATIIYANSYDNVLPYRIPAGSTIRYPNQAEVVVGRAFELDTKPTKPGSPPVTLEVRDAESGGNQIEILDNIDARQKIDGSSWGTFTIFLTIPIALLVGVYMTRFRKGKVLEASIIGVLLTLGAVWVGGVNSEENPITFFRSYFNLSEGGIALSMAIYGFIAAVLPVSVLLCPRDYLSAFLKIGTVGLLVIGVIIARPVLQAPAVNWTFINGGPTVSGAIFPFLFITIMCGAVSGFHALVSSGTTPKMIDNEKDARTIGYGAMLIEGLVGIVALIAAASLPASQYYHMNTAMKDLPQFQQKIALLERQSPGDPLVTMERRVDENLTGRTGGAVTLAVGMAKIFDDAAKGLLGKASSGVKWIEDLMPYWYHFAIMFEALFILTTIDAGTRVGRFLLQETMGKWVHPKLGQTAWWPSVLVSTLLVVGGWYYFINAESFNAIWAMFGVANQMLAVIALCVATVALVRMGKGRYAWVTLAPMIVVTVTTMSAAVVLMKRFWGGIAAAKGSDWINPVVSMICLLVIVACTVVIMGAALFGSRRGMPPGGPDFPVDPVGKGANALG
jgi:carbon starvation protein